MKVQGEAASANVESVASYPEDLAKMINKASYTKPHIFNVNETTFDWKKMPSRTFITGVEKSMSGFTALTDRLTLLVGANAADEANAHLPFQNF